MIKRSLFLATSVALLVFCRDSEGCSPPTRVTLVDTESCRVDYYLSGIPNTTQEAGDGQKRFLHASYQTLKATLVQEATNCPWSRNEAQTLANLLTPPNALELPAYRAIAHTYLAYIQFITDPETSCTHIAALRIGNSITAYALATDREWDGEKCVLKTHQPKC